MKPFPKYIWGFSRSLFYFLLGMVIFSVLKRLWRWSLGEWVLYTLLSVPLLWYLWKFVVIPFREGLNETGSTKSNSQHHSKNTWGFSPSLFSFLLGLFILSCVKRVLPVELEWALHPLMAVYALWYLWMFIVIPFKEGLQETEPNKGGR